MPEASTFTSRLFSRLASQSGLEPLTRAESFALDLERLARQLEALREDAVDADSERTVSQCVATLGALALRLAPDCVIPIGKEAP